MGFIHIYGLLIWDRHKKHVRGKHDLDDPNPPKHRNKFKCSDNNFHFQKVNLMDQGVLH